MKEWQAKGLEKEAEWNKATRDTSQKISQEQRKATGEIERIQTQCSVDKEAVVEELAQLRQLRDSMKEEIRAMQERFGVTV